MPADLANYSYFLSTIPGLSGSIVFDLSLGFLGLSAFANLIGVVLMEKFGRRVPFVYGGFAQGALLAVLGGLYYTNSTAGRWFLGILFNLTISTAQITTGGPGYTLAGELSKSHPLLDASRPPTSGTARLISSLAPLSFS